MRTTPKIRKVQLKLSRGDESAILGIASSEPHYKISLAINKTLGISLRNGSPLNTGDQPGEESTFSRFTDSATDGSLVIDLVSNRSGKRRLITKLKNIDYFLRIHDPDNEADAEQIVSKLRDMDCITAVFVIDAVSLKDKNLVHLIP